VKWKLWLHRARACAWVVLGAVSFMLGLENSVALVWFASLYANVVTDWGAAEAADDRRVLARLEEMDERLQRIEAALAKEAS
jgi:hypothetical protein